MHNRRELLGFPIVILCLGAVTVSLGVFREGQVSVRTNALIDAANVQNRANSYLVSPLNIQSLTSDSDLIVIGQVNSIDTKGRATGTVERHKSDGQHMIASLNVHNVLKGQVETEKVTFEFLEAVNSPAGAQIELSQIAMFFLKRSSESGYTVSDPIYPFIRAFPSATVTDTNPLDRVVGVIGHPLLSSSSVEDRRFAVKVLSSAGTGPAIRLLRQAMRDKDAVVQMQALSALLNGGDIASLDIAERTLLNPSDKEQYLLENVAAALEGIKDPLAIPTLQRLLQASSSLTRLGAARALRNMRVSEGVEGLVIALYDENRKVRYEAVIGLAEFTGQDQWGPSVDLFQSDEQAYLDYWKGWARSR